MDRDTVRPVVLALLAVVAIGLAAATLDSAVVTDKSGGFGVGPPSSDAGVQNGSRPNIGFGKAFRDGPARGGIHLCYPVLTTWWARALIVGVFLLGAYLAYRRIGVPGGIAYAGMIGIPLVILHALLTQCSPPESESKNPLAQAGNFSLVPKGGSGAPGSGAGTSVLDPSFLLMAGLAVVLLGAIALLFISSGGNDPEPDPGEVEPDDTDVRAVGRAAGEAADRIESATDVDNEVYRAWREMTDHLDVSNPAASTPAEFAAAAVDAGMAREDVDRLTSLFEEVRYGGESPTEEREREAVEALRRIEREYAGGDGTDAGPRADGEGDR